MNTDCIKLSHSNFYVFYIVLLIALATTSSTMLHRSGEREGYSCLHLKGKVLDFIIKDDVCVGFSYISLSD